MSGQYDAPPPPPDSNPEPLHQHIWVAVGTERNFGGGVGWVIQSCACGDVRRVALPKDYPGWTEPLP